MIARAFFGSLLVLALGCVQVVSDIAAQGAARPMSLIGFFPKDVDARFFFLSIQHLLTAREAMSAGDMATARQALAKVRPGSDRSSLEGELAERQGDVAGALKAYLVAGDMAGLARMVMRRERAGDLPGAIALQETTVRRIQEARMQPDALARAWLLLGRLENALGQQKTDGERTARLRRSLDAYEHAVKLAPLSQAYLLSAGYEALYLGEVRRAQDAFSQAHNVDPRSIDPLIGLGRVALARGDRAQARAYARTAQDVNATYPDARALARDTGLSRGE
jgi:tetratricopeptide (TPR) repeat protein